MIVTNQAGVIAESAVIVSRVIRREVNDGCLGVCSVEAIVFSDIAHSIQSVSLGQDEVTVDGPVGRDASVELVVVEGRI